MTKINLNKIVIIVLCVTFVLLSFAVYYFTFNSANNSAKHLESTLTKAKAIKLCSTGDGGRSLDNTVPWYVSEYEIDDDNQLLGTIIKTLESQGINNIYTTKDFIEKYGSEGLGIRIRPNEYDKNPENNTYLISKTHDYLVQVNILRNSDNRLLCRPIGNNEYDYIYRQSPGKAVVEIYWIE
ncbi:MAG: hypothetical protein U0451_00755 [Candidatus Saccharimonadales bacterium]